MVVLARYSLTLAYPATRVASVLAAPEHPWKVGLDGDGRELLARVGLRVGRVRLYKHVRLVIGAVDWALRGERLMLPVRWEAAGGPPLFPRMEGTIHVEPDQAGSSRLTLNVTYDPPLGKLGQALDKRAMHRLAEATIKDFLERVAVEVQAELRGEPCEAGVVRHG